MSGTVNIETLRNQPDSARLYKWDVNLSGPGPGGADTINLRATTVDQPNPSYSVIDVTIRGFTKKEAGGIEWNPINFTVIEVDSYEVLQTLWGWGQKQFDARSGVQQNKSGYEGDLMIFMENLQDSPTAKWKLYGCVLESMAPPGLQSDKSGFNETSFSVAYDYAELM